MYVPYVAIASMFINLGKLMAPCTPDNYRKLQGFYNVVCFRLAHIVDFDLYDPL